MAVLAFGAGAGADTGAVTVDADGVVGINNLGGILDTVFAVGLNLPDAKAVKGLIDDYVTKVIADINLSVGTGTIPLDEAIKSVSDLVETVETAIQAIADTDQTDRRDETLPSDETEVSEVASDSPVLIEIPGIHGWIHDGYYWPTGWQDYHRLVKYGIDPNLIKEPHQDPLGNSEGIVETTEDSDMGVLDDLWEKIDEEIFDGWLPGGAPPGGDPNLPAVPGVTPIPGTGGPIAGPAGPTSSPACGGRPVYKYSCGAYRWVYPKRRRRKPLVTQSDLKGLAALKGVLGTGKSFDVWIATHS